MLIQQIDLSLIEQIDINELSVTRLRTLLNGADSFEMVLNSKSNPIALDGPNIPYKILDGRHRIYLARLRKYTRVPARCLWLEEVGGATIYPTSTPEEQQLPSLRSSNTSNIERAIAYSPIIPKERQYIAQEERIRLKMHTKEEVKFSNKIILVFGAIMTLLLICIGIALTGVFKSFVGIPTSQQPSTDLIQETSTAIPAPEPSAALPMPEPQSFPLTIIPFNYSVEAAGDGWKEGTIHLAFENTTDQLTPPVCLFISPTNGPTDFPQSMPVDCRQTKNSLFQVFIETLEGKTYPAQAIPTYQDVGLGYITIDTLPPALPIRNIHVPGLGVPFDDAIKFRFAQAATPIHLVMRRLHGASTITFDLKDVTQEMPIPTFDRYKVKTMKDLAGMAIVDDPGKLKVTFTGTCYHTPPGFNWEVRLPFSVTNGNQLDEERANFPLSFILYYPNGTLEYTTYPIELSAGPGQTVENYVLLDLLVGEDEVPPSYMFVVEHKSILNLYKLDCPEKQ